MKSYEIYSAISNLPLMEHNPVFEAETGRKALDKYLKSINFDKKVKVSASNDVHFKTTPIVIENGKRYIDRRNGQRSVWYQIQY
jgi:hypothetical protein